MAITLNAVTNFFRNTQGLQSTDSLTCVKNDGGEIVGLQKAGFWHKVARFFHVGSARDDDAQLLRELKDVVGANPNKGNWDASLMSTTLSVRDIKSLFAPVDQS